MKKLSTKKIIEQLATARAEEALPLEMELSTRTTDRKATHWLAKNFDPAKPHYIEWLCTIHKENLYHLLKEILPACKALQWAENVPITGRPEQWNLLRAVPSERLKITMTEIFKDHFLASASFFKSSHLPVVLVRGSGGLETFFHQREDKTIDVILHRARANGFSWLLLEDPQKASRELPLLAMIDPLHESKNLIDPASTESYGYIVECYEAIKGFILQRSICDITFEDVLAQLRRMFDKIMGAYNRSNLTDEQLSKLLKTLEEIADSTTSFKEATEIMMDMKKREE